MSEVERRMRGVFRGSALEQLARIAEEVDALRRGTADPATAASIPPRLRLLKGEASMVGLRPIAASLNAAEGRAAEAAWDAVAAALPVIVRELELDGGDVPAAVAPAPAAVAPAPAAVAPAPVAGRKPDAIDELIDLSTTYHRLAAGLVRAAGDTPDAPSDALRELASGADAARRQLDEVLSAAWSLRLTPVDELLGRLAAHAAELARARSKPLKVQISGHAELEPAMLEALEAPLLHIVLEAVTHGIEEPEARGDKPAEATLALSVRGDGGLVEIAVEDDGRGVELADVRAEIERLGGTLALDVRPGLGTRCVVALPAAVARRGSTPPRPPRPRRVLVADDSPIVLEIVTSILEGADLITSTAPDGEEAWSALEAELPDLLLTDVDMPRLDGLGLLCRVRERWPRLPVVMLTTHDRDADRRHAISLGASGYIVKAELDEGGLVELVHGLIDAAEAAAVPTP